MGSVEQLKEADYVVVGGGTAGSVIAARLSEDPAVRVVLLEAGPLTGPPAMNDPAAWPKLLGTEVDWAYSSTPQEGLAGNTVPYARGRALGGSSSINAMAHLRGHRATYDRWAKEGAAGWGYEDLLPYFRRSESAREGDPLYRGHRGPMQVSPLSREHPFALMALEAVRERGWPLSSDLNGSQQEGAAFVDKNVVEGQRQSAADAYLRPVLNARPNLTVVTDALVHRLTVTHERCVGAEYTLPDGVLRQVRATAETVVCGGAFGSPQLLMLSGIGPADEVRAQAIDVAVDLPNVGSNLQDHPVSSLVFAAKQPIPVLPNTGTLLAALRSHSRLDAPDIQLMFVEFPFAPVTGTGAPGGFSIVPTALNPRSRGTVRLASPEPGAAPLIDPAFLNDVADVQTMLTGMRLARDLAAATAFDALRDEEIVPGPEVNTRDQQLAFLRRTTHSAAHPVGTCRIGPDAASAVVDSDLRVHGVAGLRIADASVMPSVPGANTNATVLAVAERAADLLLGRTPSPAAHDC